MDTVHILFFLRLSLAAYLPYTVSWRLILIRRLKGVIGLDNNHRFIRGLFLVFKTILLKHLIVNDPIIMDNATIFALLACQ
jgi:hypothetical protein